MKRILRTSILFGRLANRTDDEFIMNLPAMPEVKPNGLRWFCGMNDLKSGIVAQAL